MLFSGKPDAFASLRLGYHHSTKRTIAIPLPQRLGSAEIHPLDRLCIAAAERPMTLRAVGCPIEALPRQVNGHKSDPPDDVYSFGITIFEMLSLFKTHKWSGFK
jgi:serine/threonine protein kinase